MDPDGVLYLLESKDAFNFLVDRHSPQGLDSMHSVAYAMVALELSGEAVFPIHLVKDTLQLAPASRKKVTRIKPWRILHGVGVWTVGFVTVTPTFEGPYAISWAVTIAHGKLVLVERNPD